MMNVAQERNGRFRALFVRNGSVRWGWKILAFIPLLFLGDMLVTPVQVLTRSMGWVPSGDLPIAGWGSAIAEGVAQLLAISSSLFTLYLAQRFVRRKTLREIGLPLNIGLLRGFLLGGAILIVFWTLLVGLYWATGLIVSFTGAWQVQPLNVIIPAVILTCLNYVQVGVIEEGIFRGYLPHVLAERLPIWAAVLISSLLFSAVHGASTAIGTLNGTALVMYFAFLTFFSIVMTLAYHISGSLWLPIGMHWMFDWIDTLLGADLPVKDATLFATQFNYAQAPLEIVLLIQFLLWGLLGLIFWALARRRTVKARVAAMYAASGTVAN